MAAPVYTGRMMLAVLTACATPEKASEEIDGSLHWFFANFETATDDEMRDAVLDLDLGVAATGTVGDLTADEQATVELDSPRDIADVTGLFITGPVACTFEDNEIVHLLLDQNGVYEEATGKPPYDEYERVYTSDDAAYLARETSFLWWETTYTVTPVFQQYTAFIVAGVRYVPEKDGVGPILIERDHLPSPATMTGQTEDFFDQDYQIDIVVPDGEDSTLHAYAMWRDLQSAGLQDEDKGVQNLLLDGLDDFDRDTEKVCALGNF
jgi:hypothetical protein